ncbi:unnamed protein product, partial [Effrenium voratum]
PGQRACRADEKLGFGLQRSRLPQLPLPSCGGPFDLLGAGTFGAAAPVEFPTEPGELPPRRQRSSTCHAGGGADVAAGRARAGERVSGFGVPGIAGGCDAGRCRRQRFRRTWSAQRPGLRGQRRCILPVWLASTVNIPSYLKGEL